MTRARDVGAVCGLRVFGSSFGGGREREEESEGEMPDHRTAYLTFADFRTIFLSDAPDMKNGVVRRKYPFTDMQC